MSQKKQPTKEIFGDILKETEKAFQLGISGVIHGADCENAVIEWFPKSQINLRKDKQGSGYVAEVPLWLLRKKAIDSRFYM